MPVELRSVVWHGAIVSSLLILTGCSGTPARAFPAGAIQAAVVSTAPAVEQALRATLSYSGTIAADVQVNLLPRTSGIIIHFPIQPGQSVKQGDLIAQLDDSTQQAQLQQAQAALAGAQANLLKLEQGATPTEVGVAKAAVDSAIGAVTTAQHNLEAAQQTANADTAAGQQAIANTQAALASAQQELAITKASQGTYQTAIQNAQQALHNAQANQSAVQSQITAALAADQTAVQNAQNTLQAVQATIASGTPVEQQQLAQAKNALYTAQVQRDASCNLSGNYHNTQSQCDAGNANVNTAQTAVQTVQAQIQQSQAQAQQSLVTAQSALKTAEDTATADRAKQQGNLVTAQTAVDQVAATLKAAQAAFDQAVTQGEAAVVAAQNQLATAQVSLVQTEKRDAAAVAQAQGALQAAQSQLGNAQANYRNVVAPPTTADIAAAKASIQQDQALVTSAQTAVDQMKIAAPFDGVLGTRVLQVGALASPTTPIATLVSSDVQVQVNVEQANIGKVSVGQPVELTVTGYPGVTFPARITLISPVADTTSHSFQTTITPDPANSRLKPGMFANVVITTQEAPKALVVPSSAVVQQNSQSVVWVVKNARAQAIPVKLGIATNTLTQVLSGLTAGESVVTVGQAALRSGEAVRIVGVSSVGSGATPGSGNGGAAGGPRRAFSTPTPHA